MAMNDAIVFIARRNSRRDRAGWAAVALLTAVTATVGLGALAAARRSLDAHPRMLDRLGLPDAVVFLGVPDNGEGIPWLDPAAVAALPEVRTMALAQPTLGAEVDDAGNLDPAGRTSLIAALDDRMFATMNRVFLKQGRLPRPDEADAVAVSRGASERLGVGVGDRLRYKVLAPDDVARVVEHDLTAGTLVTPRVVGVYQPHELGDDAVHPFTGAEILASPAFLDAHPGIGTYRVAAVDLHGGKEALPAFRRRLVETFGPEWDPGTGEGELAAVRRVVRPEATAAGAFGVVALMAGLIVVIQALARQCAARRDDQAVLAACGLTGRQRATTLWLPALGAIVAGVAAGLAGAGAVSALGPVGVARLIEPDPGLRFDPLVILAGGLGLAVVLAVAAAPFAWRAAIRGGDATGPAHPGVLGRVLAAGPLSVRVGAALAGRAGGARSAVRGAVLGSASAVVAVVAVATFGSSLDRLAGDPAYYGQDYDLATWDGYGVFEDDVITGVLSRDPDVEAVSLEAGASGEIGGREVSLSALSDMGIGVVVTAGRAPAGGDEVVLGRRLAQRLGAGVGDDVTVTVGDSSRRYRVVGHGVLPNGAGDGALFTHDGLYRVAPDAEVGFQYVRIRPGGEAAAVQARYEAAFDECAVECDIDPPAPPTDVSYLHRVGNLPNLLAGALAVLGVAATIHALVLVGRRNRRSLAALRAVGATRRQAGRVVLVQASLVAGAAVAIGIPLGWAAGRAGWRLFADDLGVVPDPTTPWLASLGVMAALFVLAHAAAVLPSRAAARVPVASDLREER